MPIVGRKTVATALALALLLCFQVVPSLQNSQAFAAGLTPSAATQLIETLHSTLAPIPHPDLSKVDPAIKEQIEAAQSDLSSSLEKSETAAGHLAQRYGNLGKLYHAYDFPDAAVACYTNAHRLAPQEFIWPYYAARIYQDKGDN